MFDALVVRGSGPTFAEAFERDRILQHELRGRPVFMLCSGLEAPASGRINLVSPSWAHNAPPPINLNREVLRQVELEFALHRTGAILQHPEYHYRVPSGEHADAFVRIADSIRD